MRRMISVLLAGFVLVGLTVGCGRRAETSFTVAGSTAFQPFAEKLADQFMAQRPDVAITVQGGGSSLGIQSARSGTAEIGMADLVALPPDAAELTGVIVARDGIVMVVHPSNPVKDLTAEQIRAIFNGTIRNWKDVGGQDAPIRVVTRETGSGTRTSFEQIIGGISLLPEALVQDSNGTIRETVANDKASVGYLSHGLVNEKVHALTVDGAACEPAAIASGAYKLVRPVFLMTKGAPTGAVKDFMDYMLSAEGQGIIHQDGLLPAS
ncbi:MAG: phosphate ABC transporter substrate-binding protein [Kiritimatiellia bacterium]